MDSADWSSHVDGFTKGNIGVFPGFFGSWEVWDKLTGEWRESTPRTSVEAAGTREETIAQAKGCG